VTRIRACRPADGPAPVTVHEGEAALSWHWHAAPRSGELAGPGTTRDRAQEPEPGLRAARITQGTRLRGFPGPFRIRVTGCRCATDGLRSGPEGRDSRPGLASACKAAAASGRSARGARAALPRRAGPRGLRALPRIRAGWTGSLRDLAGPDSRAGGSAPPFRSVTVDGRGLPAGPSPYQDRQAPQAARSSGSGPAQTGPSRFSRADVSAACAAGLGDSERLGSRLAPSAGAGCAERERHKTSGRHRPGRSPFGTRLQRQPALPRAPGANRDACTDPGSTSKLR
jgi:hypothetical protein